jgi:hypothetical protein
MRTSPSGRVIALASNTGTRSEPVELKVWVVGLKSSALLSGVPAVFSPPAMSTCPFVSVAAAA